MNETKVWGEKKHTAVVAVLVAVSFAAGCLAAGLFQHRSGSARIRELDQRYAAELARAADTIGNLGEQLDRERDIVRGLRERNNAARKIAQGLADTTGENVRNLQDAVRLINKIRTAVKELEDFYNSSDTGNGAGNGHGNGHGNGAYSP